MIETFVGPMEVFADDDIMAHYFEDPGTPDEAPYIYENEVIDFIDRRLDPGDTWLNIGANLGYFARYMAQRAGSHGLGIVVEPDPDNMVLLKRNLANVPGRICYVEGLATRDNLPPRGKLYRQPGNSGDGRGWPCASDDIIEVANVRLGSLQIVRDNPPHLAVVDAQGMDVDALKGLGNYQPPYACIELWPHGLAQRGQNIVRCVEELCSWGYRTKVLNNDLGLYTVELEDWAKARG